MPADSPSQRMTCMEVWGGNAAVDTNVVIAGLDAWVFARPYHDAAGGGDVYYVSSCATGRITRLLLADVSGHGSEVSAAADQLRTLMRRYVNFLDQRRLVGELNARFTALSADGCFATALAMTFFGPTRRLTLCNAGHPPPLLYRAKKRKWEYVQRADQGEGNIPWGIETVCTYDQFDVPLAVGDMVLCYTDSLPEARSQSGELLGFNDLLQIIAQVPVDPPGEFITRLVAAIEAQATLQGDDATMLLFRANGTASAAPLVQRLLMPAHMLRAMYNALRAGKHHPMPWPDMSLANLGGAIVPPLSRTNRRDSTH